MHFNRGGFAERHAHKREFFFNMSLFTRSRSKWWKSGVKVTRLPSSTSLSTAFA